MTSMPPHKPSHQRHQHWMRQFSLAMELPFVLVAAVVLGGFFGYLLDGWLGTAPVLMLALGGLGFYAGLREMLRRVRMVERQKNKGNNGGGT